ncbi:MAG: methyltransferase domain-containing protein [Bacteroidetes bacterium]|nr:MAG: methyltransferase domain-containing protein [Bacteroidota bacterium]
MRNCVFSFKQFSVNQDKCSMKLGTDSVLIGAWAKSDKAKRILDIGSGTGVIALMLAQRTKAEIDAIDIEYAAHIQAKENFHASKWNKRLNSFHTSLQEFSPGKKYDLIVSNPPYFPLPRSHEEKAGNQARFTHLLSFCDLADHVVRLLASKGSFYVIFPIHEGAVFTNEAEKRKLYLSNFVWVKTTNRKKFPKRILMKFGFSRMKDMEDTLLVIQAEKKYTDEYKFLTKDYFLQF